MDTALYLIPWNSKIRNSCDEGRRCRVVLPGRRLADSLAQGYAAAVSEITAWGTGARVQGDELRVECRGVDARGTAATATALQTTVLCRTSPATITSPLTVGGEESPGL